MPDRSRATKRERVDHIEALMLAGEWVRGKTGPGLAKEWGVHPGTVEHDAAEASRRIRDAMSDEEYRSICIADLHRITDSAIESEQYTPAVNAVRLRLEARALLKQRHEVHGEVRVLPPHEIAMGVVEDPELRPLIVRALKGEILDGDDEAGTDAPTDSDCGD